MRLIQMLLICFMFQLHIAHCDAEVSQFAKPPFMNLMEFRAELLSVQGKFDDLCPMNLRIKPALRSAILKQGQDYNWLISDKNYSADQRKADKALADALATSMKAERSEIQTELGISSPHDSPWVAYTDKNLNRLLDLKVYPGFYPLTNFISYQVGSPHMPWGQDRGFTFKVFFEFKNPQADITSDLYRKFSQRLAETGFQGDSKIPVLPGWVRFTWNNIIVHATSIESAKIAEKVGLEMFGERLFSYSRGVDVRNAQTSETADWPHFLCYGDPSSLPSDVTAFVQNK